MDYVKEVRSFIIDDFLFEDDGSLHENTSFLEMGIIDSTGVLQLATWLEETYGIEIADEELIPENLDSLSNIATFLSKKRNGGSTAI